MMMIVVVLSFPSVGSPFTFITIIYRRLEWTMAWNKSIGSLTHSLVVRLPGVSAGIYRSVWWPRGAVAPRLGMTWLLLLGPTTSDISISLVAQTTPTQCARTPTERMHTVPERWLVCLFQHALLTLLATPSRESRMDHGSTYAFSAMHSGTNTRARTGHWRTAS